MNSKNLISKYLPLTVLVLLAAVPFWRWFLSFGIMSNGDWQYYFHTLQQQFFLNHLAWIGSTGLGQSNVTLSYTPLNIAENLLGSLGLGFPYTERLLYFWPMVAALFLGGYSLSYGIFRSKVAGVISGLIFLLSPVVLASNSVPLFCAFGFAALSIHFFISALETRKSLLTSVILLFVAGAYDFRVVYITLWILGFYIIFDCCFSKLGLKRYLRDRSSILITFFAILVLLNTYWLAPLLVQGATSNNALFNRGLFGNAFFDLSKSLTLFFYTWTGAKPTDFVVQPVPLYFWLIPLFAFFGLVANVRNRKVLFFGFVALLGILLSKQVDVPFTGLYQWLFNHLPGFNAFREASKFYFLTALGYAVLIGSFVDWMWRHLTVRKWQVVSKYVLTALIAGIFLWNTKPLITGEIGTIYVERHLPSDYVVLKDFITKQPDYFRTYWVPIKSRWGIYTNNHPAISGVSLIGTEWKQFIGFEQHNNNWPIREQIMEIFNKPYASQLLDSAAVKYVVVPLQDKANKDDFFQYYGGDRQFYVDALNQVSFLKRIDIGTKDIAVYENTHYEPYMRATGTTINLGSVADLDQKYPLIRDGLGSDVSFTINQSQPDFWQFNNLFSSPRLFNNGASIQQQIYSANGGQAILYQTLNDTMVGYKASGDSLHIDSIPPDPIALNGNEISQTEGTYQLITQQPLAAGQQYLSINNRLLPVERNDTVTEIGSLGSVHQLSLMSTEGDNLAPNGSFEDGLWQTTVGDCNNHDAHGALGMRLDTQHAIDGGDSLELAATRHIACTSTQFDVNGAGDYLLDFQFQSPGTGPAGYNLQFNDAQKTVATERIPILATRSDQWQEFQKKITVPTGATSASLALYAYESNGHTENIVRYDDVNFKTLIPGAVMALPPPSLDYQKIPLTLRPGQNTFSLGASSYTFSNLIPNGSFEDGLWQRAVGDCNKYDTHGVLNMRLDTKHGTAGRNSLELMATRHTACTSTQFSFNSEGTYLLNLHYQSLNSQPAGYYLQFNDDQNTVISGQLPIPKDQVGKWQEFQKTVTLPTGATSASLTLYAYESDGFSQNVVRYDDVSLTKIPNIARTYYMISNPRDDLGAPRSLSFELVNPTKKVVHVSGAVKPFVLKASEEFNPDWKLYQQPLHGSEACQPVHEWSGQSQVSGAAIQCRAKTPAINLSDIGYLWQTPVFNTTHVKINDYANGWVVDPDYIKKNSPQKYWKENSDGTIDFNLVMYYQPQSYFYLGLIVSSLTLVGCIAYLVIPKRRRRAKK